MYILAIYYSADFLETQKFEFQILQKRALPKCIDQFLSTP
jgi:hypothetical protein